MTGSSPARLTPGERHALLDLARRAVAAKLGRGPEPAIPEQGPLAVPRGAFVTLTVDGELRGCIGTFTPDASLSRTVARMAVAAASEDPRFPPLTAAELPRLAISVSALDPLRRAPVPEGIEIGRDGVLVRLGWHRGTLLPQVAVEQGWDAEEFLARTCLKAGLPPGAWRDPAAVVELFSVEEMESFPGDEAGLAPG